MAFNVHNAQSHTDCKGIRSLTAFRSRFKLNHSVWCHFSLQIGLIWMGLLGWCDRIHTDTASNVPWISSISLLLFPRARRLSGHTDRFHVRIHSVVLQCNKGMSPIYHHIYSSASFHLWGANWNPSQRRACLTEYFAVWAKGAGVVEKN